MSVQHSKIPKNNSAKREAWFGKYMELGKTEARQAFLRLLDKLQKEPTSLVITDRGEKVAVILGYKQYKDLVKILEQQDKKVDKNPLAGLIGKVGDWKKSDAKVKALFDQSLKRSAKLL